MYSRLVQANILVLVFSVITFWSVVGSSLSPLRLTFIILLGAMPLVWFATHSWPMFFLHFGFLFGVWILPRVPNPIRPMLFVMILGLFCWGTLLSGKIISWPFTLHSDRLIFDDPSIKDGIIKHQLDAVYIPFRIRLTIYNQLIYFHYFFRNLMGLFTVQRFYDIILLANIYPLVLGIVSFVNAKKNDLHKLIFGCVVITALAIGINKSTDPFNSLFFALPIIIFFVLNGFTRMNNKVYLLLLGMSLVIATTPQM